MPVRIESERFFLRELSPDDVTQGYLDWLSDPDAKATIAAAATTKTLEDLRGYVRARCGRDDVLFLGVFDKVTGRHVGNVKYEPVDSARGYATMGILIGETSYRGKGVAPEVLAASGRWLRKHRGIREIVLGVDQNNLGAIRAYEKAGYRRAASAHLPNPNAGSITMVWFP